jgi:hypothetical protein
MFWLLHGHGVLALLALVQGYQFRQALLGEVGSRARRHAWRLVACMGVLFGTGLVLYVRYRAAGGVRTYMLANHPLWHTMGFEWKEALGWFALLLTLGLAAIATRAPLGPGDRAQTLPLLAALLICLLLAGGIGFYLSFFIKAVA